MANVIKIKRTELAVAPTTGDVTQGELAYMEQGGTGDGRLYIGVAGPAVEEIGGKYWIDLTNTLNSNALVDGDFTSDGFMKRGAGAGNYSVVASIDLSSDVGATRLPYANYTAMTASGFLGQNGGAGNVEEMSTAEATALLTSFGGTIKGLVPTGSGNVGTVFLDGTGAWSQIVATTDLTATGTTDNTTFLRGDDTWAVPAGGGNVSGPGTITDNTFVFFNGVTGTLIDDSGTPTTFSTDTALGAGAAANDVISSQLAVKTYVDNAVASGVNYQGAFDPTAGAGAGNPDLDTITSATGDMYTVTVAGTYSWTTGSAVLEIGDVLIAEADGVLNDAADWTIVQNNLSAATASTSGYVSTIAQTFGGTKTFADISGTDVGSVLDSFVIDGGTF